MFCERCGFGMPPQADFCSNCGHPVNRTSYGVPQHGGHPQYTHPFQPYQQMPQNTKSPVLAIFLAIAGVVIVLILVLIMTSTPRGDLESEIIGTWGQTGLINFQYVFRADGTGTRGFGVIQDDFRWSLDGNRITMTTWLWSENYTISIRGNMLTFRRGTIPGVHRYYRVR